ncbi:O-antigen ligase family protein [Faecalimonas umbilicata]|nr:O-antigen ligase family protein [Faecalimonas umbilicata]
MITRKKRIFAQVDILFIILFFLSFVNSLAGALFTVSLVFYWQYGVEGALKALILVTTRGIMSSAVAATASLSSFRWIIILGSSFIILFCSSIPQRNKVKVNNIVVSILGFAVIVILTSFLNSSYPIISMFKVISFALPFVAVIIAVADTSEYYDWNDYFTLFYTILFILSAVTIPFGYFRITNDDFQGIFNQVNMFGIIAAVYIAAVLNSDFFAMHRKWQTGVIVGVLIMIYLSASRTGMFTSIAVIISYVFLNKKSISKKIMYIILLCLLLVLCLLFMYFVSEDIFSTLREMIYAFMFKDNSDTIWASRQIIIEEHRKNYLSHPFIGTGFMTPYIEGVVSYEFNFDLVVEPGNLIWTLLGNVGILGSVLFAFLFLVILTSGKLRNLYLLVGAFAINMGERVLFSSNNMSILLYLLIALYVFDDKESEGRYYEETE